MIDRMMELAATRVVSMAGLAPDGSKPWGATPRGAMEWLARMGARGVVIDGTRDGIRARQLDGSARRAIAALLRRLDLRFRGIDLWIPIEDFAQPATSNRAIDAASAAIELCADLHRLSGDGVIAPAVNLALPTPEGAGSAARAAIEDAAARFGTRIADFGSAVREIALDADSPLGVGLDPLMLLNAGLDPVAMVAGLKGPLRGARDRAPATLTRAARAAGVRFDGLAYRATLSTRGVTTDAAGSSPSSSGPPMVLDLRNEERPQEALLAMWSD